MDANRSLNRYVLFLAVFLAAIVPARGWAASSPVDKVEYSADRTMETEEATMQSTVFHGPGKERSESEMGGRKQVTIVRTDKKILWVLMPDQKMFMEKELKADDPHLSESQMKVEKTEVGKETMNGLACTKYKVIATRTDGNKMGGFMWVSAEGVPVKQDLIALEQGKKIRFKMELKNIHIGKQNEELFTLPEGYQPMPSFGGMAGGGMKGMKGMKGMFGGK